MLSRGGLAVNVASRYGFDPDDYPLIGPETDSLRSLGRQPPEVFLRRGYPTRWRFSLPDGTGDFAHFIGHRQLLWDGLWFPLQPTQCNDRVGGPFTRERLWSAYGQLDEGVIYTLNLFLYDAPDKWVTFVHNEPFTSYYRGLSFLTWDSIGPGWTGSFNGPLTVTPVSSFAEDRY